MRREVFSAMRNEKKLGGVQRHAIHFTIFIGMRST